MGGSPMPRAPTVSNLKRVGDGAFTVGPLSINQLVFVAIVGQHDLAPVGEFLGDRDDVHLCLVDVAQADRAHHLHVLAQDLRRAFRHVGEEEIPEGVRKTDMDLASGTR